MQNTNHAEHIPKKRTFWFLDLLLIPLLIFGWFYRTVGQDWDEGQLLHPDELFLVQVEQAIQPVESFAEYWDTDNSTLNPHNRGMNFFVYGTLPITLTRYAVDWVGGDEWFLEVTNVGRSLSAAFDLATVLLVYLIASKLFDRRVGILAAFFLAFSVLNIQLSHFFAVDTFTTFFTTLALYFAVRVAVGGRSKRIFNLVDFIFFGIALGMAVACKVTIGLVALTLPLAVICRLAKLEKDKQFQAFINGLVYVGLAAVISFFVFRVFQPYAFAGPGFFNMSLNQKWIENLKSLSVMAAGDVDWPPSLQWARIPFTFSVENLIRWGLGIPLGVTAFIGLAWMARKMIKGEWPRFAVIWVWTSIYFIWQSSVFNPSMRYQLPIYPCLAIIGAWVLFSAWEHLRRPSIKPILRQIGRITVLITGMVVILGTLFWASAFINIYKETENRIAASEWIYENIPGPLSLEIESESGISHEQISLPYSHVLRPTEAYTFTYVSKTDGYINQINAHGLEFEKAQVSILVELIDVNDSSNVVAFSRYNQELEYLTGESIYDAVVTPFDPGILSPDADYIFKVTPEFEGGQIRLIDFEISISNEDQIERASLNSSEMILVSGESFEMEVSVEKLSNWNSVYLKFGFTPPEIGVEQKLSLEIRNIIDQAGQSVYSEINLDRPESVFLFDEPIQVEKGRYYTIRLVYYGEGLGVTFSGAAIGIETSWDRGLPLPISGYNAYGGIYEQGMDFDLYADDTDEKRVKLLRLIEEVEYITISSSRVWASISKMPERFPLVDAYYRYLLGCPNELTVEECYITAEEGMFTGQMGFELAAIIDSNPQFLGWEINDQSSEEAFTVYDHPKTFIFKKNAEYDHSDIEDLLNAVDLSGFVRLLPKDAGEYEAPSSIMLPESDWEDQQDGGTWSELYDTEALINRSQFLSFLCWYLALMLLGFGFYPIIRLLLPNLADRGYPLARISGLLVLAYLSWLAGSAGLSFERGWIFVFYLIIVIAGLAVGYLQRAELIKEFKENKWYYINIEIIFLALFILSLLVRLGNPDLWHPAKGGEKPMDFAYFNAVLKSSSFPPYDPWYAGGYINYYYFGFVLVGVLVKLLGIVPSVAYNLIIPSLFAMFSIGIFSVVWNLVSSLKGTRYYSMLGWIGGGFAAFGTALIGNLNNMRMILVGLQQVGAGGAYSESAFFLIRWGWGAVGLVKMLGGAQLPHALDHWYWNSSRVIPDPGVAPITEFPWFTFIYADLHAHMISFPITVLALSWVLSLVLGSFTKIKNGWQALAILLFGGMIVGSLNAINTWDLPTYLVITALAVIYAGWRFPVPDWINRYISRFGQFAKVIVIVVGLAILLISTFGLYKPYTDSYVSAYKQVIVWTGTHTPMSSYLIHWGLFLAVIIFWFGWETRQWMANTPISALSGIRKYKWVLIAGTAAFILTLGLLDLELGVKIHWLAVPLMLWSGLLLLRKNLSDGKRLILFLIGTALFLTVFVEIFVLYGDIGRMNTVFKFYLQAWIMFGISSATAFSLMLLDIRKWNKFWRISWQVIIAVLFFSAMVFPMIGTFAKIKDRMTNNTPLTLDGMLFMNTALYFDKDEILDLSQDYEAIRWMQENVQGTPVIVEAHVPEYRWSSRFSTYTGLPTVMGWQWHQTQQRGAAQPNLLTMRVLDVPKFYLTTDTEQAQNFLDRYQVEFIILGQLERAYYPGAGLLKFEELNGVLWNKVYEEGLISIYQVIK